METHMQHICLCMHHLLETGQDFVNGTVLVSVCSLGSIDQSGVSGLVHAGKQSVWRATTPEPFIYL